MDDRTKMPGKLQQHQLHVLEIDLILDMILSNLTDIDDFKAVRLVCRQWNQAAIPIMNRKSSTRIVFKSEAKSCDGKQDNEWMQRCSEYLALLKVTTAPQIIFPYITFENISLTDERVQELLTSFGRTIRTVELKYGKDQINLAIFGSLLLAQCPNLEELIIVPLNSSPELNFTGPFRQPNDNRTNKNVKKLDIHCDNECCHSFDFFEDLFAACPNVNEALCHDISVYAKIYKGLSFPQSFFKDDKVYAVDRYGGCEQQFLSAIRSTCFRNLRDLTLSLVNGYTAEFLGVINRKLKLTSFKVNTLTHLHIDLGGTYFREFLESQANTLEELIICSLQAYGENSIFPAVMPKLKMLHLGIHGRCLSMFPIINVQINFPVLTTLILNDTTSFDLFLPDSVVDKHLELKSLKLFNGTNTLTMTKAADLFPNVVELAVTHLSLENMGLIWSQWSQLQILHFGVFSSVDDLTDAITGVTLYQWASAAKTISRSEMHDLFPVDPSITMLTNLKTLSIAAPIENFCFHHSFSKMAHLEYIGIEADEIKISEEAIMAFSSKNPNRVVDLKTNHEYFKNEKSVFNFYKRNPLLLQEFINLKR